MRKGHLKPQPIVFPVIVVSRQSVVCGPSAEIEAGAYAETELGLRSAVTAAARGLHDEMPSSRHQLLAFASQFDAIGEANAAGSAIFATETPASGMLEASGARK